MAHLKAAPDNANNLSFHIEAFVYCKTCRKEWHLLNDPALRFQDYEYVTVGFTPKGMQIWCKRHHMNILNVIACDGVGPAMYAQTINGAVIDEKPVSDHGRLPYAPS